MIACEQVRRFLPIWIDGESIPLEEAAMRAHVDGCGACRRTELREREYRAAVRAAFVTERAPGTVRRTLFLKRHRTKLFAAAAMLLAAVGASFAASDDVVTSHEGLSSGRLALDYTGAGALEQVRARLGLDVQLPALAQSSLKLRGARVDGDSALLLLDDGDRPVTLSVQARRGPRVNGPPVFRKRRAGAYEIVSWDHGALSYSLVSAGSASAGCAACHVTPP